MWMPSVCIYGQNAYMSVCRIERRFAAYMGSYTPMCCTLIQAFESILDCIPTRTQDSGVQKCFQKFGFNFFR
jgi:hypothetical protein